MVDFKAQAILGYRFKLQTSTVRVRGCTHPESKAKFCGECGAPMWTEEEDTDTPVERILTGENEQHEDFKLIQPGEQDDHFYLGLRASDDCYSEPRGFPLVEGELKTLKGKMDKYCIKLNLNPDHGDFGLWAIAEVD